MNGVICLRGLCVALATTAAAVDVVLSLPCYTDIHGSIDGTIFFTASYRCGGSGGLDHGCAQARGRQHQQQLQLTGVCGARACMLQALLALAMLMRDCHDCHRTRAEPGAI